MPLSGPSPTRGTIGRQSTDYYASSKCAYLFSMWRIESYGQGLSARKDTRRHSGMVRSVFLVRYIVNLLICLNEKCTIYLYSSCIFGGCISVLRPFDIREQYKAWKRKNFTAFALPAILSRDHTSIVRQWLGMSIHVEHSRSISSNSQVFPDAI